jgi:hypothetical protein
MSNILYTVKQVSELLHYTERYIRQLCKDKKFSGAYQINSGKWLIPEEGLESIINKRMPDVTKSQLEIQPKEVPVQQPY